MTTENKTKPAHEIKLGSVKATVWMNRSKNSGVFFGVTFSRLYKSGDSWKRSESFGRNELPLVQQAAQLVLDWIAQPAVTSAPVTTASEPFHEA